MSSYDKVKDAQKKQRQRKRISYLQYLSTHPCVDCGEVDSRCLDFDHVKEKNFAISVAMRGGRSWKTILTEIESNCEVRCANCHRIRHFKDTWHNTDFQELKLIDWHGTKNGYSYHKCRCEYCKEANRIYQVDWRNGIAAASKAVRE